MIRTIIISILLLTSAGSWSQEEPENLAMDFDTSEYVLHEAVLFPNMYDYRRTKRKTIKVYPYAKYAVNLLEDLDSALAETESKRERRRLIKETNKLLEENFTYAIKNMTEMEGKFLVLLIHKYSDLTAYDIIKDYRGGVQALFWQGLSKLGGADLKREYHEGDDAMFDHVVEMIEAGRYKVAADPYIKTKEQMRQEKKEERARQKAKRKAERKARRSERE